MLEEELQLNWSNKAKVINFSTKIETFYLLCLMEIFFIGGEDCGTVAALPVLRLIR